MDEVAKAGRRARRINEFDILLVTTAEFDYLRIGCPKGRGGSNPSPSTKFKKYPLKSGYFFIYTF